MQMVTCCDAVVLVPGTVPAMMLVGKNVNSVNSEQSVPQRPIYP
jgi:hypothetical protein